MKQQARVENARKESKCIKCFKQPRAADAVLCVGCLARNTRLKDPTMREQELAQRPLRRWRDHRKSAPFLAPASAQIDLYQEDRTDA